MAFQPTNSDELGALWMRSGAKGDYMTGVINGVPVVVFPNTKKASDKAPDYRVLKSRPKGERPEQSGPDYRKSQPTATDSEWPD